MPLLKNSLDYFQLAGALMAFAAVPLRSGEPRFHLHSIHVDSTGKACAVMDVNRDIN